ncbi:MAG: alpha/beta hydrolase [Proteobacteria bacterium]|nr:alpha/beta hydrolase [Pseudomonadota bacterium]
MPYVETGNARLYYEDQGQGEPILTNHGLMEDGGYWSETGVAADLALRYRVVSMDIRGHGRTVVEGEPHGYDAETMAADIDALADALGLERFHLLTHATGGMVGVRHAMARSARLLSLMLTDTGSATRPDYPGVDDASVVQEGFRLAAEWIKTATIEERLAGTRAEPGIFLFKMAEHPDSERMWKIYEGFLRRGDPAAHGAFMSSFYTDPDPRIEGLRNIGCPTLILLGEFDLMFLEPSALMAAEIPGARHVVLDGIGHMTAIEDPGRTIREINDFLDRVAGRP